MPGVRKEEFSPPQPSRLVASLIVLPENWIEHRRSEDREPVGWIVPDGDRFRVVDILGRPVTAGPIEWMEAEAVLDELGIGFLADRYVLTLTDGTQRPVRIAEAGPEGITVVADEWGSASAVGANSDRFRLPFPVPDSLVPATSTSV